ncbi:hypothetical protein BKN38_06370 [Helicobacter sp. CLO-3]|uniref:hypothetical protein n=1 Tax=unclassified Helicobacter TaxID=2593540 RepID=UPI00080590CF|nr:MULTISPECIES: hypothetical protein [unclassified Helicobacter]OBV29712.1 hypothetical protein BA723_04245 [Helicobacter sp. CLO-3]OHU82826.1 hypothetical protein BKN38_06370 [Helicobacter sp. CLO-3]
MQNLAQMLADQNLKLDSAKNHSKHARAESSARALDPVPSTLLCARLAALRSRACQLFGLFSS